MCRRRLRSGVRTPLLTDCRRIISARLHEQGYSFTEIGEELRRHPTTILRLVQTHQTLLNGDPTYPTTIEKVLEEILDRKISDKRTFPSIDVTKSGTRKEELLIERAELSKMWVLRRILMPMGPVDAMEFLLDKLKYSKTNADFFQSMNT